jgi:hypothetical protein
MPPNPWDNYPKKKRLKDYPPQHPPKGKKKEEMYADSMRKKNGNGA